MMWEPEETERSQGQRGGCEEDEGGNREEEERGEGETSKVSESAKPAARCQNWLCCPVTKN